MDVHALLDPDIATALEAIGYTSVTSLDEIPAMRARRAVDTDVELSDQVERTDVMVAGAPGDPEVAVRVHRPEGVAGPLPCVYSIHGGGYIAGTYAGDDQRFDTWCPRLGYVGVSVEYRLAPETPFPGPLEDCYAGLTWTLANAGELDIDPARIGILGFSAGGGLAAGLALLCRDRGEIPVAFQQLIYPMIDDRMITPSSHWEVPIWNRAANEVGWRAYLGDLYGTDHVPAYAAAARATDLSGLPPTFLAVGALDGFCDEDIEYTQRLNQAGVPVELHVYPGAPHGFDGMLAGTEVSKRARRHQREWLSRQLHP
jgi:acetyl esterase/lipase